MWEPERQASAMKALRCIRIMRRHIKHRSHHIATRSLLCGHDAAKHQTTTHNTTRCNAIRHSVMYPSSGETVAMCPQIMLHLCLKAHEYVMRHALEPALDSFAPAAADTGMVRQSPGFHFVMVKKTCSYGPVLTLSPSTPSSCKPSWLCF
jgi:hypothetical protein